MGGLLFPPLDTSAPVVYNEVMERHAANIQAKATRALELIEEIMIPEIGFDTHRDGLTWYRANLYGTNRELAEALWTGLGAAEGYFADRGTLTKFTESRGALVGLLDARIRETRPMAAVVEDDPFACFASNKSGQN